MHAWLHVTDLCLASGDLQPGIDIELALDLFSGPLFHRYLMMGRQIDQRFVGAVIATVLRGLTPVPASRSQPNRQRP